MASSYKLVAKPSSCAPNYAHRIFDSFSLKKHKNPHPAALEKNLLCPPTKVQLINVWVLVAV